MLRVLKFSERNTSANQVKDLDLKRIPKHIAIVMDGNGRWAQSRGLPRLAGHHRGVETVKAIAQAAQDLGIEFLTLYTFSTENWKRPVEEVNGLMKILERTIQADLDEFHEKGFKLNVIGGKDRLAPHLLDLIAKAMKKTQHNTGLCLNIAFNYGGRYEIVEATKTIARQVLEEKMKIEEITEDLFSTALFTAGIPDPELFIRTSNESRISNFLLWQSAYAELVFVKTYWPDFTKEDLINAIHEFQKRNRRFGRSSSKE
jgi:undecaprenyl diphosphate synthase